MQSSKESSQESAWVPKLESTQLVFSVLNLTSLTRSASSSAFSRFLALLPLRLCYAWRAPLWVGIFWSRGLTAMTWLDLASWSLDVTLGTIASIGSSSADPMVGSFSFNTCVSMTNELFWTNPPPGQLL